MVGPKAGLTRLKREMKSPENGAYLLFSGRTELHQDEPLALFISRFYCGLGVAPADNVIKNCHPANLKAGSKGIQKTASMLEPGGKAAPWAAQGPCRKPDGDPQEGSWLH